MGAGALRVMKRRQLHDPQAPHFPLALHDLTQHLPFFKT